MQQVPDGGHNQRLVGWLHSILDSGNQVIQRRRRGAQSFQGPWWLYTSLQRCRSLWEQVRRTCHYALLIYVSVLLFEGLSGSPLPIYLFDAAASKKMQGNCHWAMREDYGGHICHISASLVLE